MAVTVSSVSFSLLGESEMCLNMSVPKEIILTNQTYIVQIILLDSYISGINKILFKRFESVHKVKTSNWFWHI